MADTPFVASYVVPADTPLHRNLGDAAAKAITGAILRFDQLFHQAAREDEFMASPPATFKSILDEAKASTAHIFFSKRWWACSPSISSVKRTPGGQGARTRP
jgi:hypothetical protein